MRLPEKGLLIPVGDGHGDFWDLDDGRLLAERQGPRTPLLLGFYHLLIYPHTHTADVSAT